MKRKKLRLTPKQAEHMLFNVLEIGSRMLVSGAEVQRVENSIYRMCTAYGSETTEVFCMTYMIVVTISSKQFGTITLSRRIHNLSLNLYELLYLNALSRRMCSTLPVSYTHLDVYKRQGLHCCSCHCSYIPSWK